MNWLLLLVLVFIASAIVVAIFHRDDDPYEGD
jgi:hypothetical protein